MVNTETMSTEVNNQVPIIKPEANIKKPDIKPYDTDPTPVAPVESTEVPKDQNETMNGSVPTISNHSNQVETVTETVTSYQTSPLSDTSRERIKSTFSAVNSKVVYLVHWDNVVHSGAALASILAFLMLTAYSSLFNIICGFALLAIGADWIYVLGTKQFKTVFNQDAANPHLKYLENPPQIKKEDLDKYVDVWVDIINLSLVEATKIILIENPLRSIKYVGLLYCLWTVASWFSFRTIIAIATITAFAVPKAYRQNQVVVDQHLEKAQTLAQGYMDRGLDVVNKNTGNLIPKINQFATSMISNPDATKKQA